MRTQTATTTQDEHQTAGHDPACRPPSRDGGARASETMATSAVISHAGTHIRMAGAMSAPGIGILAPAQEVAKRRNLALRSAHAHTSFVGTNGRRRERQGLFLARSRF